MLKFSGQVLELSMPVERGTKPPPPAARPLLGHRWVQAWTDNDYLNLRALFDIMSSSGCNLTVWELSGIRPTVRL